MLVSLPTEIWELIIDIVSSNIVFSTAVTYSSLRACALTCKTWQPRATFCLYKHVTLVTLESTSLFARTLTETPEICKIVQALEFSLRVKWSERRVTEIPFPPSLIPRLTRLDSFELVSCTIQLPDVRTRPFDAWLTHKHLRTLLSVGLFPFPTVAVGLARAVYSSPGPRILEELDLTNSHGWTRDESPIDSAAEYPLVCCQNLVRVKLDNTASVDHILPLLGTSIQKLPISTSWDDGDEDTYQAIETLHDLRSLTLILRGLRDCSWAGRMLSLVRSAHMEEVVLDVEVSDFFFDYHMEHMEHLSREGVDDLLSNSPFDNIRRLKVTTFGNNSNPESSQHLLNSVQVCFPRCHARGITELEFRDGVP